MSIEHFGNLKDSVELNQLLTPNKTSRALSLRTVSQVHTRQPLTGSGSWPLGTLETKKTVHKAPMFLYRLTFDTSSLHRHKIA